MNALLTLGEGINDWLHRLWFKPANSDLALNPDGSIRFEGVDWLFMFILWVCIISFVLLMVPMFWWSWKYRRRPGVPAIRTPNHNTPLEITWVVGPLIVVTFIFFWGFHGYIRAQVARADAAEIMISGKKWVWEATYINGAKSPETAYFDARTEGDKTIRGNVAFPIFVVPAGRPVKFRMSSQDVIHSFYIPDMRMKMDVFPNRYTSMTFTPLFSTPAEKSQVGTILEEKDPKNPGKIKNFSAQFPHRDHFLFCAEYCGDNHSEMAGIIRVVSPEDYATIVANWGNVEKTLSPVELGKLRYETAGCVTCHSIDGSIKSAPSWKGALFDDSKPHEFEDGGRVDTSKPDAWENYIRESIEYPQAHIVKGFKGYSAMSSYKGQLSEKSINGIIAYIRSLNGKARPEDAQPPAEEPAPAK